MGQRIYIDTQSFESLHLYRHTMKKKIKKNIQNYTLKAKKKLPNN